MASSIKASGCSPDSTVSSLLTSWSPASSNPPSNSLIWYKGKLYSSASEALEAYIEDFDLSLTSPGVKTGKICICQSTAKQGKFSKPPAKENQGLEGFNQEAELAPLPRQAEGDLELLSLATDDLLAFPEDGSLPFLQSIPAKPELPSTEWKRQPLRTPLCPSQPSALKAGGTLCLQEDGKAAPQEHHKDFSPQQPSLWPPEDPLSLKGNPNPWVLGELSGTWKNYPRWLTSHKSELSVSGLTSIPSLHYPGWLSSCSLSSGSQAEHLNTQSKTPSSQTFEILKERHKSHFFQQKGCLPARGGAKAEERASSACPPESSFWRHAKKPFRGDQLEGVTLEAEDLAAPLEGGSPSTTDILGTERSWEKAPGACKPAVAVCCEELEDALSFPKADIIQKFLEDCLHDKNKLPGGAEDDLKLCDREIIPLIHSVQKALQHFSSLKSLPEGSSTQQKQPGGDEDKEEKKNYL
ncbi:lung adenoma susceptibility protein 2-like [Heliangelus exortis]|uniref:lung adenoma susceptibility protein 2-like n=1 Tax=Heliangelus exortis TaxID=472823 RepID=UPI003A9119EC